MMNSTKVETKQIEIYENERLWIGRGFSKQGLFPTERGPYSTNDGSLSWKSVNDACTALIRGDVIGAIGQNNGGEVIAPSLRIPKRGWSFHEEDTNETIDEYENSNTTIEVDMQLYPCGEDGWQYFADFLPQSMSKPNKKRGMLDFVRRRRLKRTTFFRPDHFLPPDISNKCDYCDSNVVNTLSNAMLDALSLATLFAYGLNNNIRDVKALPLKSKLIDTLDIGNNCDRDPVVDINKVKDRLVSFAEMSVSKPGQLMHMLNPDGVDQNLIGAMPERRKLIASNYLTEQERINLARLLIKDVDRYSYKMHCKVDSCSCNNDDDEEACEFRLVPCPNLGCGATFSFKHQAEHDEECGFKPLPCPNGCGMEVPRNDVHVHVRDKCSLRAAECPLASFGCTSIVQARDITDHLNDTADKHFMLIANRMVEYQNAMKDMNARIRTLEEKNALLERELQRSTIQLQSKNEAKAISNDVKKLTKRLGTLENTCRTEFKKVEYDRRSHKK